MTYLTDLLSEEDFIFLDHAIPISEGSSVVLVGYFPYETKRIRGTKVNSAIIKPMLSEIRLNRQNNLNIIDNKVVLVFNDSRPFGTESNFAIFYHDGGCVIGELDDITKY